MMRLALDTFRLLPVSLAGWLNQQQQDVIDYRQEENRVLREQLGGNRLHFNDDQRRRLAVRAKKLSRRMLHDLTTIVTRAALAWVECSTTIIVRRPQRASIIRTNQDHRETIISWMKSSLDHAKSEHSEKGQEARHTSEEALPSIACFVRVVSASGAMELANRRFLD
jgi:hypothetical protein